MQELIDLAFKRIAELEKKIERYYKMLELTNELDFILNGTYILNENLNSILAGEYTTGE